MPKFLVKRWHGMHHIGAFIIMVAMTAALSWLHWLAAALSLLATIGYGLFTLFAERAFRRDLRAYLNTLSYRVKKAGNEVISELPFGIVLYNDEKIVEWHNPFVAEMLGGESFIGQSLKELFPSWQPPKGKELHSEVPVGSKVYSFTLKADDRLIYIRDITQRWTIERKYEDEKLAIGIVMMDNLEEITQGMDEQQRAALLSKVTSEITDWAQRYQLFLKRLTSDRYMFITDHATLKQLEQSRFDILDQVREMTHEQKIPMTLSIGIAAGGANAIELGQWMQTSLDFALGRGGDQAAIKIGEKQTFYGGKSGAVEKRTRVRARVVAHALRDMIKESSNVIIMGHKMPDMDSVGAAIGVLKAAQLFEKEAYIVIEGVNPAISRLMEMIKEEPKLSKWFISPEQALTLTGPKSLAVVVDTHRASMVKEPKLLSMTERVVVLDHHRRSEEFINNPLLVYMEPYASSTCELITELLQYIHERVSLDVTEATALLAGITVDTKNFLLRTGARTFEAASFLRRNGADSTLILRMLKEDLNDYVKKAEIIKQAEIVHDHIAIAVTEPNRKYSQLMIAQAADTLLNMNDVLASFVIGERPDGFIAISARSLGHMNVQVVMERMGGGGHLTNAAAQLECSPKEAAKRLKQVLKEIEEEEGLFE
ncbi:DHH family phosphoesterase [Paenibacillus sp. GCM10012307]|uniref:Cyclic-di-AMP phosphodiesterase n=1 Tax=Paenibacillus roseus TaxID=2798579 RepID=A0A934J1P5_9BACL|nr:DHH family phosphoesterase [Paenibacillus roseus]MBJ6361664.1 DHH family phosphoesterase [Paenibacillus roseus]